MINLKQLRDAKLLSKEDYITKYSEDPEVIIKQDEEDNKECLRCQ